MVALSSGHTYHEFGNNHTDFAWMDKVITNGNWDEWRDVHFDEAGAFTLPVCTLNLEDYSPSEPDDIGLDYFFRQLKKGSGGRSGSSL